MSTISEITGYLYDDLGEFVELPMDLINIITSYLIFLPAKRISKVYLPTFLHASRLTTGKIVVWTKTEMQPITIDDIRIYADENHLMPCIEMLDDISLVNFYTTKVFQDSDPDAELIMQMLNAGDDTDNYDWSSNNTSSFHSTILLYHDIENKQEFKLAQQMNAGDPIDHKFIEIIISGHDTIYDLSPTYLDMKIICATTTTGLIIWKLTDTLTEYKLPDLKSVSGFDTLWDIGFIMINHIARVYQNGIQIYDLNNITSPVNLHQYVKTDESVIIKGLNAKIWLIVSESKFIIFDEKIPLLQVNLSSGLLYHLSQLSPTTFAFTDGSYLKHVDLLDLPSEFKIITADLTYDKYKYREIYNNEYIEIMVFPFNDCQTQHIAEYYNRIFVSSGRTYVYYKTGPKHMEKLSWLDDGKYGKRRKFHKTTTGYIGLWNTGIQLYDSDLNILSTIDEDFEKTALLGHDWCYSYKKGFLEIYQPVAI